MLSAQQLMATLAPHGILDAATWTPSFGPVVVVEGIFRAPYADVLDVDAVTPTFSAASADLPGVARGDMLVYGTTTYHVATVRPDGLGFTVLTLQEQ